MIHNWLITDTHFYHDNMVEMCGRPPDFTNLIIENLRRTVKKGDIIYHLGDVILYKHDQLKTILDSIDCTKILVMGNHDRKSRHWYMNNGFTYAAEMIVIDDVLLSHRPIETLPTGVRLNVHGHWHNSNHERPAWWSSTTHKLLSIEQTRYKPVKLVDFTKKEMK